MATQFLEDRRPGSRRNGQVVDLVVAIAQVAQHESVPRKVCLNAADGIRVLATGVTDVDQVNQILDIADALCLGNRTAAIRGPGLLEGLISPGTGSTNAGGSGNTGGSDNPGGSVSPGGNDDPGEADACSSPGNSGCNGKSENSNANENAFTDKDKDKDKEDKAEENQGDQSSQSDETGETDETDVDEPIAEGLGSNDAAKSPNENAVEHANEHATDNEHGQNGEEHGSGPPEGKGKDKDK